MLAVSFDDARGRRLLLALSGGSDSVALLMLLLQRREADGFTITAAHFNHGIRGRQADDDAAFVRDLCSQYGVPLIEGKADVPALAREQGTGIETAAREARYAFLRSAKLQCGGDWIALAHHRDDQAETVLMHLLRGCGSDGACGMARLDGDLYRPLLDVPKAELCQYLQERGIPWREDTTNAIPDNPRNTLRLKVMPLIEESYPAAAAALTRYARIMRIDHDFLEKLTDDFLSQRLECGSWGKRLRLSDGYEEALLRRALRLLCPTLDAANTDALMALTRQPRGAMTLPGGFRAECTNGNLYLLDPRPSPKVEVTLPQADSMGIPHEVVLEHVARLRLERGHFPIEPDNACTEICVPETLNGAVLRTRRTGDRFHPLGAPGDRLLSDFFTDRKVDRPLRDWWPLVAHGDRVLWVCGLALSETARVWDFEHHVVRMTLVSADTLLQHRAANCRG